MTNKESLDILVIDYDAEIRYILGALLRHAYNPISVKSFEEAETYLLENEPEMVICNIESNSESEQKFISNLRKNPVLRHIPVLALTTGMDPNIRASAFQLGVDDFIGKPFEVSELLVRVRYMIKIKMYQNMLTARNNEIEKELDIARLLQEKLLPTQIPDIPGLGISSTYIHMDKVGGDYYDLVQNGEHLDILIADASGHGIPAAFLTSLCKMTFQFYAERVASTDKLMLHMDNTIIERSVKSLFVTALFARLNLKTRMLRYTNAAHCPLILHRKHKKEVLFLEENIRRPLGVRNLRPDSPKANFIENSVQLEPGDRIVFYTDGITECMNPVREMYGSERFTEFLLSKADEDTDKLSQDLLFELYRYAGFSSLTDDLAFIIIDINELSKS